MHPRGHFAQPQKVGRLAGQAEVHAAGELALQLPGDRAQLATGREQGFGLGQQQLARPGQRQPARAAIEQRHAQALLQALELAGDRGLGDAQRFRGLGDIANPRHGDEGPHLVQLHGSGATQRH
ncbi:hypothetical protein D3C71_1713300 [compost metagenome]